jgi:hypothetical protein
MDAAGARVFPATDAPRLVSLTPEKAKLSKHVHYLRQLDESSKTLDKSVFSELL